MVASENGAERSAGGLAGRLEDYMRGFAKSQPERLEALARVDWRGAARAELLRRAPLVAVMDDELLAAVAAGELDPGEIAATLRQGGSAPGCSTDGEGEAAIRLEALTKAQKARMVAILERIAREEMLMETLETRRMDRLDFSEKAVWVIRAGLEAAYLAGMSARD